MTRNLLAVLLLVAGGALAHQGVQNATVMARMDGMKAIGAEMKRLGQMAKGEVAFDAEVARSAAASIRTHAAQVPALFEDPESDPMDEAKPEIWDNFDDFAAKAREMESIAADLSGRINGLSDVQGAMATLGATCKACHSVYRKKK